ncbi:MAG: c-type cytochrome biogenesis protein CcmI [Acidobacteriota bacterium]
MIVFWLICALFVAIALAFVIPTLLPGARNEPHDDNQEANVEIYRDQILELEADLQNGIISEEQYQQDRDEIERRLLDDVAAIKTEPGKKITTGDRARGPVYAIAVLLPVIALGLYLRIGNPAAISATPTSPVRPPFAGNSQPGGAAAPRSQQDIEANVASLAKRMEQNPGDAAGWAMLGRSYLTLQKFNDASNAYARAASLTPDDADVLADYAFAMGMANGKSLLGQPAELIRKALALDPENPKALELAGSAAFESKNYKDAINYWQRLMQKAPKNSELAQALSERIEQAKSAQAAAK